MSKNDFEREAQSEDLGFFAEFWDFLKNFSG